MEQTLPGRGLDAALDVLRGRLEKLQPGVIAVSGGVDSRLLAHAAGLWKLKYRLVHAAGPLQSARERSRILDWLRLQSLQAEVVDFDPLLLPDVRENDPRRCYFCKQALFTRLSDLAARTGLWNILDGTQADDLQAHRPGLQALTEAGVHSPLAQSGMGKAQIRRAAALLGLADPDQPSRACLLTRFPYGHRVSRRRLAAAGRVEDCLEALGLRRFRFRVPEGAAPVLQVHPEEWLIFHASRAKVEECARREGFGPFVALQTESLSGYFDKERT